RWSGPAARAYCHSGLHRWGRRARHRSSAGGGQGTPTPDVDRGGDSALKILQARRDSSFQTGHYDESLDVLIEIGLQERVIVLKRHAAIRVALRAEHVGVCQKTAAAKDFLFVLWNQAQRTYPMERAFP